MKTGHLKISSVYLQQLLMMPEGWEITAVSFDRATGTISLSVAGENVPVGHEGEFRALITRHEDGQFTKWEPATPPGPSMFIREFTTGHCFWCKRPREDHGPDFICPK